jgi:hypothetical protein
MEEGYKYVPQEPWAILGFIVPILVAYSAYRLTIHFIFRPKEEHPDDGKGVPSASSI